MDAAVVPCWASRLGPEPGPLYHAAHTTAGRLCQSATSRRGFCASRSGGNSHAWLLCGHTGQRFEGPGGGAENLDGRISGSRSRTSGSAMAAALENRRWMAVCLPPPGPVTANHPVAPEVNPDASGFLPSPVAAGARSMGEAAAAARLVAPPCCALGMAPGLIGAVSGAVDLTPVAAAADEHLDVAAGAEKKAGRPLPSPSAAAGRTCTKPAIGGILPPHSCPARCGAWRRYPAWRLRVSAAPPFQSWPRLTLSGCAVSAQPGPPRLQYSLPKGGSSPCRRMAAVPLARL
jgi:hypothetical protein